MGTPCPFPSEKLIICVLFSEDAPAREAAGALCRRFGKTDLALPPYDFSAFSRYYDDEMGGAVSRAILSFETLRDPGELAQIKLYTNSLEHEIAERTGKRAVNLDPGFVGRGRLTLASTKEAAHRIPLSGGIYAEMTLFYARKAWQTLPWTYMDFQTPAVQAFLSRVRERYLAQRRHCADSR